MLKMAFMEHRRNIILLTTVIMVEVTTATSQDKVSTDSASSPVGSPAELLAFHISSLAGMTNNSESNDQTENKTNYSAGVFGEIEHVTKDGFHSLASAVTLEQSVLTSLQGSFTGDNSTTDITQQHERTTLDNDEQVSTDLPSTVHDTRSSLSITTDYQPVMTITPHYETFSKEFVPVTLGTSAISSIPLLSSDDDTHLTTRAYIDKNGPVSDTTVEVEYNTTESNPWTKDTNSEPTPPRDDSDADTSLTGQVTHSVSGTDPVSIHRTLVTDGYSTDTTAVAGQSTTDETKVVESDATTPTLVINFSITATTIDPSSITAASITDNSFVHQTIEPDSNVTGKTSVMATDFTSETAARDPVTIGDLLLTENDSAQTAIMRDSPITEKLTTDKTALMTDSIATETESVKDNHITKTTLVTDDPVTKTLVTENPITETTLVTDAPFTETTQVTDIALVTELHVTETELPSDDNITDTTLEKNYHLTATTLVADYPVTETIETTDDTITETALVSNDPVTKTTLETEDFITETAHYNVTNASHVTRDNIPDGTSGTPNITDATSVTDYSETNATLSTHYNITYSTSPTHDRVTDHTITYTQSPSNESFTHYSSSVTVPTTNIDTEHTTGVASHRISDTTLPRDHIDEDTSITDYITDTSMTKIFVNDTVAMTNDGSTDTGEVADYSTTEITSPMNNPSMETKQITQHNNYERSSVTYPSFTDKTAVVDHTISDTTPVVDHNIFHTTPVRGRNVSDTASDVDYNVTDIPTVDRSIIETTSVVDQNITDTTPVVDHVVTDTDTTNISISDETPAVNRNISETSQVVDYTVTDTAEADHKLTDTTLVVDHSITDTPEVNHKLTYTTLEVDVKSTYTTRNDTVTAAMPVVVTDTSPSQNLSISGRTTELNPIITNNTVTDSNVTNVTKAIGNHIIVTAPTVEDLIENATTATDHNVADSTPPDDHNITETDNNVADTSKSTHHNITERALVEHNVTDTTKSDDHSLIETITIVDHTVENAATAANPSVTYTTLLKDRTVTERTLFEKISTDATLAGHQNVTATISVDYNMTEPTTGVDIVSNSTTVASHSAAHTRLSEAPNITETTLLVEQIITDATTAAHYSFTNTNKSGDYTTTEPTTIDSITRRETTETPREHHNFTDPQTVLIYNTTDKTPVETFPMTTYSFTDMERISSTDKSITSTSLGVENNFSHRTEAESTNISDKLHELTDHTTSTEPLTDISDADTGKTSTSAQKVSSSLITSTSDLVDSEAMTTESSGLLTGPDLSLERTTVRISPEFISQSLTTSAELSLHQTTPTQGAATTTALEPDSYSTLEPKESVSGSENTDDFTAAQGTPTTSSEAAATPDSALQGISEELTSTSASRPVTTTVLHVEVKDTSIDGLQTVETQNSTLDATNERTTLVATSRTMITSHSSRVTSVVTPDTTDLPNSSARTTLDEATSTSGTQTSGFSTSEEASSEALILTVSSGSGSAPQWVTRVTSEVTMLAKTPETTMSGSEISSTMSASEISSTMSSSEISNTAEPDLAATSNTITDVSITSSLSPEVTTYVGTAPDAMTDSSTLATQTSEVLTLVTTSGASFGNPETSYSGNFSESVDVTKSVNDGISSTVSSQSESSYKTDFRDVSEPIDTPFSTTEKAPDMILTDSLSPLTTAKENLETKITLTSQEATVRLSGSPETTLNVTVLFQTSPDLTLETLADQTSTPLVTTSENEHDFTSSEPSLRPLATSESTSMPFTFEATSVSGAVTSEETRGVSETGKTESFWSMSSKKVTSGHGTTQGSLSDVSGPETTSAGTSLHGMTASSLGMSSQKTVSEQTKEPEMNSGSSSDIFTSASQSTILWLATSSVPSPEVISNEIVSERGESFASTALVTTESSIPETSSGHTRIISVSGLWVTTRETSLKLTSGQSLVSESSAETRSTETILDDPFRTSSLIPSSKVTDDEAALQLSSEGWTTLESLIEKTSLESTLRLLTTPEKNIFVTGEASHVTLEHSGTSDLVKETLTTDATDTFSETSSDLTSTPLTSSETVSSLTTTSMFNIDVTDDESVLKPTSGNSTITESYDVTTQSLPVSIAMSEMAKSTSSTSTSDSEAITGSTTSMTREFIVSESTQGSAIDRVSAPGLTSEETESRSNSMHLTSESVTGETNIESTSEAVSRVAEPWLTTIKETHKVATSDSSLQPVKTSTSMPVVKVTVAETPVTERTTVKGLEVTSQGTAITVTSALTTTSKIAFNGTVVFENSSGDMSQTGSETVTSESTVFVSTSSSKLGLTTPNTEQEVAESSTTSAPSPERTLIISLPTNNFISSETTSETISKRVTSQMTVKPTRRDSTLDITLATGSTSSELHITEITEIPSEVLSQSLSTSKQAADESSIISSTSGLVPGFMTTISLSTLNDTGLHTTLLHTLRPVTETESTSWFTSQGTHPDASKGQEASPDLITKLEVSSADTSSSATTSFSATEITRGSGPTTESAQRPVTDPELMFERTSSQTSQKDIPLSVGTSPSHLEGNSQQSQSTITLLESFSLSSISTTENSSLDTSSSHRTFQTTLSMTSQQEATRTRSSETTTLSASATPDLQTTGPVILPSQVTLGSNYNGSTPNLFTRETRPVPDTLSTQETSAGVFETTENRDFTHSSTTVSHVTNETAMEPVTSELITWEGMDTEASSAGPRTVSETTLENSSLTITTVWLATGREMTSETSRPTVIPEFSNRTSQTSQMTTSPPGIETTTSTRTSRTSPLKASSTEAANVVTTGRETTLENSSRSTASGTSSTTGRKMTSETSASEGAVTVSTSASTSSGQTSPDTSPGAPKTPLTTHTPDADAGTTPEIAHTTHNNGTPETLPTEVKTPSQNIVSTTTQTRPEASLGIKATTAPMFVSSTDKITETSPLIVVTSEPETAFPAGETTGNTASEDVRTSLVYRETTSLTSTVTHPTAAKTESTTVKKATSEANEVTTDSKVGSTMDKATSRSSTTVNIFLSTEGKTTRQPSFSEAEVTSERISDRMSAPSDSSPRQLITTLPNIVATSIEQTAKRSEATTTVPGTAQTSAQWKTTSENTSKEVTYTPLNTSFTAEKTTSKTSSAEPASTTSTLGSTTPKTVSSMETKTGSSTHMEVTSESSAREPATTVSKMVSASEITSREMGTTRQSIFSMTTERETTSGTSEGEPATTVSKTVVTSRVTLREMGTTMPSISLTTERKMTSDTPSRDLATTASKTMLTTEEVTLGSSSRGNKTTVSSAVSTLGVKITESTQKELTTLVSRNTLTAERTVTTGMSSTETTATVSKTLLTTEAMTSRTIGEVRTTPGNFALTTERKSTPGTSETTTPRALSTTARITTAETTPKQLTITTLRNVLTTERKSTEETSSTKTMTAPMALSTMAKSSTTESTSRQPTITTLGNILTTEKRTSGTSFSTTTSTTPRTSTMTTSSTTSTTPPRISTTTTSSTIATTPGILTTTTSSTTTTTPRFLTTTSSTTATTASRTAPTTTLRILTTTASSTTATTPRILTTTTSSTTVTTTPRILTTTASSTTATTASRTAPITTLRILTTTASSTTASTTPRLSTSTAGSTTATITPLISTTTPRILTTKVSSTTATTASRTAPTTTSRTAPTTTPRILTATASSTTATITPLISTTTTSGTTATTASRAASTTSRGTTTGTSRSEASTIAPRTVLTTQEKRPATVSQDVTPTAAPNKPSFGPTTAEWTSDTHTQDVTSASGVETSSSDIAYTVISSAPSSVLTTGDLFQLSASSSNVTMRESSPTPKGTPETSPGEGESHRSTSPAEFLTLPETRQTTMQDDEVSDDTYSSGMSSQVFSTSPELFLDTTGAGATQSESALLELKVFVAMSLDVRYKPSFADNKSQEFLQMSAVLITSITNILQGTGDVRSITVTDMRPGSTVVFYTAQYTVSDVVSRDVARQAVYAALESTDQTGSVWLDGYNVLLAGPTLASTHREISNYTASGDICTTDAASAVTCQVCQDVCTRNRNFYVCVPRDADDSQLSIILGLALGITLPVVALIVALIIYLGFVRKKRQHDASSLSYAECDPSRLSEAFGKEASLFSPMTSASFYVKPAEGAGKGSSPYIRNWQLHTHDVNSTATEMSEASTDTIGWRYQGPRDSYLRSYKGPTSNIETVISQGEANHLHKSDYRPAEGQEKLTFLPGRFSWDVLYRNTSEEFRIQRPTAANQVGLTAQRGTSTRDKRKDPSRYTQSTRL